jgi:CDP-glycerol glycerophosphotransferase (TagB/SpsB family)
LLGLLYSTRKRAPRYGHGDCTTIAVFGEATRSLLISEGVDDKKILVTGSPKFDRQVGSMTRDPKSKLCKTWRIPPQDHIVLLVTSYFVEEGVWTAGQRTLLVRAVAEAAAKIPRAHLVIRIHLPRENRADYENIVRELPSTPVVCDQESISDLLQASSLVISVSSTVLVEALVLGKPVIVVDLFGDSGASYFRYSGAMYITDKKDISPAIRTALCDPRQLADATPTLARFLRTQVYTDDGKSSERVAQLMRSMTTDKGDHQP